MTDPIEMAHIAAERLQGSCLGLHALGPEFEDLQNDAQFCAELDQLVFCCEECDWWFAACEMSDSGRWICEACEEELA